MFIVLAVGALRELRPMGSLLRALIHAYLALTAALLFDRLTFLTNFEIFFGGDGRRSVGSVVGPERVDIVRGHDFSLRVFAKKLYTAADRFVLSIQK